MQKYNVKIDQFILRFYLAILELIEYMVAAEGSKCKEKERGKRKGKLGEQ